MQKERGNDRAGGFNPVSAPDYLPRTQSREVQSQRLRAVVARTWHNVALLRERMQARGVTPDAIGSIDDIAALLFTVKADLRDTYPFGLFASPMDEVVRLHASSGTTGSPSWSPTPRKTSRCGPRPWPAASPPAACTAATLCRTPSATGCLPAAWAPTTAPRPWARR